MISSKQALTVEQQGDQLIHRCLEADRDELIERLKVVNYVRLSAWALSSLDPWERRRPRRHSTRCGVSRKFLWLSRTAFTGTPRIEPWVGGGTKRQDARFSR